MENIKGLRWLKCDLHLHTPASKCFEKICTAKEYIAKIKEKKLDVIAITDHNNAEWINQIKEEAEKEGIIVFPGVEVTCGDSHIHFLILFEVNKTSQNVEDFLLKLGMNREEFGKKEAYIDRNISDLLEEIKKENLIIIPAHIDDYSGLNQVLDEQIREQFLSDDFINAIQIVHEISNEKGMLNERDYQSISQLNDKRNFSKISNTVNQSNELNLSKLTFSDNPYTTTSTKHGLDGIGSQYTWIKMKEKPDLESLRQALIMKEYRVKNIFESKQIPYRTPDIWIEKIEILNTELNNDVIVANFNPQMTNIIGGRGTGKSSILSIIRGALDQKPLLEGIRKEFDDFYRKKDKKLGKGIFREDSKINIYINFSNEKYKIEICFNNDDRLNLFKNVNGEYIEEKDLNIFKFFKIEAYSQKEIYELANKSNYLLEIIDSSIEEIKGKKIEIEELKLVYKQVYSEIEKIKKINEKQLMLKTEIDLEEGKISKIDSKIYSELLLKKEQKEQDNKTIIKIKENYANLEKIIPEISFDILTVTDVKKEIESINNNAIKSLEILREEFFMLKDKIKTESKKYIAKIVESQWKIEYDEVQKELKEEEEKISREFGTLDLGSIKKRIEEKKTEFEENIEKVKEGKGLIARKVKILEKIIEKRKEIYDLRINHLRDVLKDSGIKIKVNKYRDKNDFELKFRKIISRETEFSNDISELKEYLFQGLYINQREKLIEKIDDAREGKGGFHSKLNEVLKGLNNENMADIELLLPEDEIKIEYKKNDSYQSLSKASAGQKTSAILTYILSKGKTPLILDQPEDDLDNGLIYNLIVENLKRSKEKRQVIVVTHNANIPVNGDSDYVVIMDSESKDINVKIEGSIDDKEVISSICNIMEGGKTAFDLRGKKYK